MQWEEFGRDALDKAGYVIPGEQKNSTVTPYFRYETVLNQGQSELHKKPVYETIEVVELRFAANSHYKPVFRTEEMCTMDPETLRMVTWAERYKKQYQAFVAGSEQEAEGTPLEELLPYGISQAQLSLCRALNIYSIEALAHIEGPGIKKLGVHGNTIKPMAQRYLADRTDGRNTQSEINELKRQLAELRGDTQLGMGEEMTLSNVIPEVVPVLPEGYENMTDEQLKDEIQKLTGARPRGIPRRDTLIGMLDQAKAA